ncbi:M24 family metallopeptidase [Tepidibacillus fermentans]|uniref:Xaa-Pro aminopeptidase n=1 Tax=Tepidibacillus fermentans TaxID=1281767 RepID=A0A4R3KKZ4_9BACI|nr:Xaa-Pro peptidase family protein [Tepidibacillus fermentans]TCS84581.1 Xaa-Pro aminopeptidase [Tepidibacillus fermentans]
MGNGLDKRIERFMNWMKREQIELALITTPTNVYYLTGFYTNPHERFMGLFLTVTGDVFLIVPELDKNQAIEKSGLSSVLGYSDSEGPDFIIEKMVQVNRNTRMGIEQGNINYKTVLWLQRLLQVENFLDLESGFNELRLIKDETEIKFLQEAAHFADRAVEIGIQSLKIGKSELEIIAEIEYQLKKQGIERMSFDTMVLTGKKSALPHGKPGKDKIQEGDFVLFDLGVVFNGYCSDISRTVVMGTPSEEQRKIYTIVKQAQQMAINAVKPNISIKQIDLSARNYISKAGYGEYFIHRTGHGLGLDVHEYPSIHEKNEGILKEGMVFTIEPGIYVPQVGGVRIEDDVIVTRNGVRVLTSFTKELIQIGM